MQTTEATIVNALIDAALARGLTLSVNDGEETTIHKSLDRQLILDAMCSTDADYLYLYDNGTRVGFVWLIWGNGCDVLSDWADNPRINALIEPVLTLADKLAEHAA